MFRVLKKARIPSLFLHIIFLIRQQDHPMTNLLHLPLSYDLDLESNFLDLFFSFRPIL